MKISEAVWLQESRRPKLTDILQIDQSVLVLGDVEIPFHHAEFVNKCIARAVTHGVRAVLYAGDLFHFGAFSPFLLSDKNADEELDEIGDFLLPLIRPFDQVYYMAGNHDMRPAMLMDRILGLERVAQLVVPPEHAAEWRSKVRISDHFYARVGDDWLVEHPKSTTTVPANAARMMAERRNMNVVMAHNHLVGLQQAGADRWAIEIGCCVDPERLRYYMLRHTTRPMMRNGALILYRQADGSFIPELLSPGLTAWGGEDADQRGDQREEIGGRAEHADDGRDDGGDCPEDRDW